MPQGHEGFGGGGGGGGFGVRRPLRFLAYKLELDEQQIAELARLLDEVKTERAQAEVDDRRTLSEFADALAGEAFDGTKASAAGERRVASAARVRDAVVRCLTQLHAILKPEQRARAPRCPAPASLPGMTPNPRRMIRIIPQGFRVR